MRQILGNICIVNSVIALEMCGYEKILFQICNHVIINVAIQSEGLKKKERIIFMDDSQIVELYLSRDESAITQTSQKDSLC
ncbi:hypothetical protein [Butyrivibrio sp. FCS014]|uniref:hypothetical protein n=1 Tax=Butyrivibrio sp. FCS014 TaxID=1408304 RepID=UPI0004666488|nr:hypothetical protein [Butyrivibrio sp. FCS014]